jgi:hypothetical protein
VVRVYRAGIIKNNILLRKIVEAQIQSKTRRWFGGKDKQAGASVLDTASFRNQSMGNDEVVRCQEQGDRHRLGMIAPARQLNNGWMFSALQLHEARRARRHSQIMTRPMSK